MTARKQRKLTASIGLVLGAAVALVVLATITGRFYWLVAGAAAIAVAMLWLWRS